MYVVIYRKDNETDYMCSLKDNWKDVLCEFLHDICGFDNEDLIDLYKKSIAMATLPDAIRLMYVFNGQNVVIRDIFVGMRQVDMSQNNDAARENLDL